MEDCFKFFRPFQNVRTLKKEAGNVHESFGKKKSGNQKIQEISRFFLEYVEKTVLIY